MRIRLIYFFFLFTFTAYPQQEKLTSVNFKNKAFTEVLAYLEKAFNVHFSFQSNDVANRKINLSVKDKPLSFFLNSLQTETSLFFEVLSDKFIAIRQINDNDVITICGILKSDTNQILSGASILYLNTGLVTDENGAFKIQSVKANTLISFQFLGYISKYVEAKQLFNNNCDTLILKEERIQIETIIIKNYLTNGIDKTKMGSFVIVPKKLGILAGLTEPDLFQSIQLLPGVNSPNETATGLHVRGGTPDQNVILWDGIKIYHSGHLFGAISPFNPYITEQINFINKGTDAKFGDGVSSVLNIKTNDSIQSKLSGGFGMNLISADAYIKIPIIKDKFSLLASGRRSFTDIYQSKAYHETSEIIFKNTQPNSILSTDNNFFFVDYNVKGILKLKNDHYISFSNLLIENKLDFGLKELDDNGAPETDENSLDFKDLLETDNRGYAINWDKKWSPNFKHQINAYYSDYYMLYNKFKTEHDVKVLTFAKKNTVKDFGFELNTSIQVNKYSSLQSGYQFSNKNVTYFFLSTDSDQTKFEGSNISNLNSHALYTTFQSNKNRNYNLNAGLRFSYYQNLSKVYLEPRFNIGKYLNKNLRLNFTGEFKTQTLSQIDQTIESGLSLENKLWSVANNSTFPIIRATQYTLGFSYVKQHLQIDIDTYYKHIKGLITLNTGFSDVFDNDIHHGASHIKGIDFYIKHDFKNYATWLSYTFDDTQNKFLDLNENHAFPGNSNIKHNLYWSHTYNWKKFDMALGWRWHTGKPYSKATDIITNEHGTKSLVTNGINNFKLPDYNRLDFSASYHFDLSKIKPVKAKIGISYLNIFKKENVLSRDYYINQTSNLINSADKASLERIANLVFRIDF